MSNIAHAVREAAAKLHAAIEHAVKAGYAVQWPNRHADLPAIAVSETAKVKPPVAEKPQAALPSKQT